jgi:hypothetical protein
MTHDEELDNIGIDLIDKYFPKGECKERGNAIILYAMLLIKFKDWVNKNYVLKKDVWISDRNCPENKMYFMDIDNWAKYNGYERKQR